MGDFWSASFLLGCGKPSRNLSLISSFFYFSFSFFLLGCPMANPVGKIGRFPFFFLVFFSVSVKVLPVTLLVSGVFVHRAFCAYFLRIERVVELRRFLWWTQ